VREGGLPEFDVVILAGGRGERLGGADKPGLVVGSGSMAATVTEAAVAAGARRVILVGPGRPDVTSSLTVTPRLTVTREDPPGAGPVPALRAGLAEVRAPWAAVLAADLPFLRGDDLRALLSAAVASGGAAVADASGAVQWLAGCWPAEPLREALAAYQGGSLRGLLGPLRPFLVRAAGPPGGPSPWLDCDTPADLAAARAWLASDGAHGETRSGTRRRRAAAETPSASSDPASPDPASPDSAGSEADR
jgi:molybdopterin-guanine dinucleotide biosynthesis protein A